MSSRQPASGEARSLRIESDTDDDAIGEEKTKTNIKALFVTLEFSSHSFSGNSMLGQAYVRGLDAAGVDVTVLSATPTRTGDDEKHHHLCRLRGNVTNNETETETETARAQSRLHGASRLVEVPVPRSLWGRLDAQSPWREFRDGAAEAMLASGVDVSSFDVVFAVDFSGVAAAEALSVPPRRWAPPPPPPSSAPPLIYLSFRVFSRTAEEGAEREMVRTAEGGAVASAAAATAALCDADAAALAELAASVLSSGAEGQDDDERSGEARRRPSVPAIDVVLPPLRREFEEMPPPSLDDDGGDDEDEEDDDDDDEEGEEEGDDDDDDDKDDEIGEEASPCGGSEKENEERNGQQKRSDGSLPRGRRRRRTVRTKSRRRNLLLCCVRLSAEKEPHRFVDVVEALAASGALAELGLVPALVGGGESDYASGVRERLVAAVSKSKGRGGGGGKEETFEPLVEVEGGFVGAGELASRFFDRALLNFHPCLADAYGMSAVEAASRGAPSVIHREGGGGAGGNENKITVGASALLRPERGESFALDLSLPAAVVAEQVASIARDKERLREVARRASERARSWSERESGERLASLARRVLTNPE